MQITITLLSDLCCGTGEAYGQVVDNEIAVDRWGLPAIPARRLKGLLREEAVRLLPSGLITAGQIGRLFGEPGRLEGCLRIDDARLPEADALGARLSQVCSFAEIRAMYTAVRQQTALDTDDIVQENSLRRTRVVTGSDPATGRPLRLIARVWVEDDLREALALLCRALRHIGQYRSRGLGVVTCRLEEGPAGPAGISLPAAGRFAGETEVEITYLLRLQSPLTLPQNGGGVLSHVEGSSVLGMFAAQYLKQAGHRADAAFFRLFLEEGVRFSPLYPVIRTQEGPLSAENACIGFPAPLFLVKTKYAADGSAAVGYANRCAEEVKGSRQPSPLTGQYAAKVDGGYRFAAPERRTTYHHSLTGKETLYTQESLCADQLFGGTITCPVERYEEVAALLQRAQIAFGRSRSAQYARCELLSACAAPAPADRLHGQAGEPVYVVLQSDMLPVNSRGIFTVDPEEIAGLLAAALGLPEGGYRLTHCHCAYTTLSGFNAQWRLQKPARRAVAAGSVYVLTLLQGATFPARLMVGENRREGCGRCQVIPHGEMRALTAIVPAEVARYAAPAAACALPEAGTRRTDARRVGADFLPRTRRSSPGCPPPLWAVSG